MKIICKKCGREWIKETASECPFCYEISDKPASAEMYMAKAYALQNERSIASLVLRSSRLKEIAELYEKAAKMGEAEAQFEYAGCLEGGIGIKKSHANAIVWYKCAARQGLPKAQYRLADMLLSDCEENAGGSEYAYFWLRVAAEFGNTQAQYRLAHCYADGQGVGASPKYTLYWLAQSAEGGNDTAACEIAEIFLDGTLVGGSNPEVARWFLAKHEGSSKRAHALLSRLGQGIAESPDTVIKVRRCEERFQLGVKAIKEKEPLIAYKFFRMSADEGYIPAYDKLAVCYINGLGVSPNAEEGVRLLHYADERGCTAATLHLGDCYADGLIEKNNEKAMEYYVKAAESGNAQAQCCLANCYFDGRITEQDITLASVWYEKASAQGYEEAIVKMKKINKYVEATFTNGLELEKSGSYDEAFAAYTEAAKFNHGRALCNLGRCYQKGLGCEKNVKRAFACYLAAIDNGSDIAKFNVAVCYLRGQGTEYSYKKAREYFLLAKESGNKEADKMLELLDARKAKKTADRIYSTYCAVKHRGDIDKALEILRFAAHLKSPKAQFLLGCHYEYGIGVEKNADTARRWYNGAVECGYNPSKLNLKRRFFNDVVKSFGR